MSKWDDTSGAPPTEPRPAVYVKWELVDLPARVTWWQACVWGRGGGGTGRKGSGVPGLWAGTSPLLLYQGLRGGLWWIPGRVSHRGCLCEPGWLVLFVFFPPLF